MLYLGFFALIGVSFWLKAKSGVSISHLNHYFPHLAGCFFYSPNPFVLFCFLRQVCFTYRNVESYSIAQHYLDFEHFVYKWFPRLGIYWQYIASDTQIEEFYKPGTIFYIQHKAWCKVENVNCYIIDKVQSKISKVSSNHDRKTMSF